jgi:glutamate formiminotransferase/formiminotetrahydrofolate cyclodeaminase
VDRPENDILAAGLREFISQTASKTPTPGGGSIAGVTGAMAAALGEMALNFTKGKKKFAEYAEYHEQLASRLERVRNMFLDLVHDDVQAYSMYSEASKLPDGDEKDEKMQLSLAASINVPRETTKVALALLLDLLEFADKCNTMLISDLVAAASLASSVTVLCDLNVRINARHLDEETASDLRQSSSDDRQKAASLATDIEEAAKEYL